MDVFSKEKHSAIHQAFIVENLDLVLFAYRMDSSCEGQSVQFVLFSKESS